MRTKFLRAAGSGINWNLPQTIAGSSNNVNDYNLTWVQDGSAPANQNILKGTAPVSGRANTVYMTGRVANDAGGNNVTLYCEYPIPNTEFVLAPNRLYNIVGSMELDPTPADPTFWGCQVRFYRNPNSTGYIDLVQISNHGFQGSERRIDYDESFVLPNGCRALDVVHFYRSETDNYIPGPRLFNHSVTVSLVTPP